MATGVGVGAGVGAALDGAGAVAVGCGAAGLGAGAADARVPKIAPLILSKMLMVLFPVVDPVESDGMGQRGAVVSSFP